MKAPATTDPCPELDAAFYRRASHHAARLYAMRVQRDQIAWCIRQYRMTGALKGRHTRKVNRLDGQLRDLGGLLIGAGVRA